jgi:hypothetical protein
VGGAVGLAVLATLSTDHTHRLLAGGESATAALNGGYHVAYLAAAALVAVAIALALTLLRPGSSAAQRPSAAIEPRAATPCPEAA